MKKPDFGLVFLIVSLTAVFAVFITVVDGLRMLSQKTCEVSRSAPGAKRSGVKTSQV